MSRKSIPPSAARSRMATAVGSSRCSPKVIVPRHSLETWRPVRPSRVCSMAARYRPVLGTGPLRHLRRSPHGLRRIHNDNRAQQLDQNSPGVRREVDDLALGELLQLLSVQGQEPYRVRISSRVMRCSAGGVTAGSGRRRLRGASTSAKLAILSERSLWGCRGRWPGWWLRCLVCEGAYVVGEGWP